MPPMVVTSWGTSMSHACTRSWDMGTAQHEDIPALGEPHAGHHHPSQAGTHLGTGYPMWDP